MSAGPAMPWQAGALDWGERVPAQEWALYRAVMEGMRAAGLPFAVGGGFAFSAYSGRWRYTKDLDLYLLPADRDAAAAVLTGLGFTDYFTRLPYDRDWIYRGYQDGVIADLIWAMANYRTWVDAAWLTRGPAVQAGGLTFRLIPPEELIWTKLYIMQRERCDWPDLFNVLHGVAGVVDWEHLLTRVGDDARLLGGLLSAFSWLCPDRASAIPAWVWDRLGVLQPVPGPGCANLQGRVALFDRRDWFSPTPAR
jgi:hypothetical protein